MSIRIKGSGQIEGLASGVTEPGGMSWNTDESTMDLRLNQDVTLQVGEETLYRARNNSGVAITNGTAVMANGTNGNSGRLLVTKAIASVAFDPHRVMGIATEDMANNGDGFVTSFGKVRGIQTNGANFGETWVEGDVLYASQTVAGALTKVRPGIATGGIISIAIVVSPHASNGTLFVRPLIEGHESAIERFTPAGVGAVATDVQSKLRESVSVKDFGAVCDGITDDTSAVQAAINYCTTFARWPALIIPGRCKITASININRPVDSRQDYFRIIGQGPGAGFYTTSAITVFTSSLPFGAANAWGALAPCSEFVSFENLQFETANAAELSYVLSGKFLRVKFTNCWFERMKCANASTSYLQTWYFLNCSIRYVGGSDFLRGLGSFDVSFLHNVIENNYRLFYSAPPTPGGNAGFRLIDNVIEGTSIVSGVGTLSMSGCTGCVIAHNHIEQNVNNDFVFSAGTGVANPNILIDGNYIVCDAGNVSFYHWTSTNVTSINNTLSSTGGVGGQLHNQVARIANFISINDTIMNGGTLSDATITSTVNGIVRAGEAQDSWTHSSNHVTKNASGEFGFGAVPIATVRAYFRGLNSTSAGYAAVFANSNGLDIALLRNDRVFMLPAVNEYANDAAAAVAGIPIGGLYRIGNAIQIRTA